jgi:hypothetical protein
VIGRVLWFLDLTAAATVIAALPAAVVLVEVFWLLRALFGFELSDQAGVCSWIFLSTVPGVLAIQEHEREELEREGSDRS